LKKKNRKTRYLSSIYRKAFMTSMNDGLIHQVTSFDWINSGLDR